MYMNMEKFRGKKQEQLVPEEKQAEFVAAVAKGKEQEKVAFDERRESSKSKARAVGTGGFSALFGKAAFTAAATGAVPVALVEGAISAAAAYGTKLNIEDAKKHTENASKADTTKEQAYLGSRGIVEEGMKQGGAQEVEGQLQATSEQIEIARKEMMEKYGGKE